MVFITPIDFMIETVFEGMSYLQSVWHLSSKHLICEGKCTEKLSKMFIFVWFQTVCSL